MARELSNDEAIIEMKNKYARLCGILDKARNQAKEDAT